MTPSVAPVLVAGAGPSGLVAALTLLQNNVPVRIIDKESHHRIGQRASGLRHRTFEVFHFLRVHEVDQRSTLFPPAKEYKLGTLEPTKEFVIAPYSDPTPSIPYNNSKLLGQPVVEGILRSHLEKYGCYVELGTELHSFEDDGERILAKLVKRKDGEEISETFEASYLIGTDGAKGVTRRQLGLPFLGETKKDFACVIGDIRIEVKELDRKHWHFVGSMTSDFITIRPTDDIAPDGFQFVMNMKQYEPKQFIADEKLLFKCISEMIGSEINVKEVVFLSEFRPNIRMVDKFNVGRVCLAGDAAHVHSPTGGQGLNTSVQDALNLAWKLSLIYKGLSPMSLLDSYTAERLPVVAEMLNITTGILQTMRTSASVEDGLKRDKRMSMLGVNYRTSPIVLDEFTHTEPVPAYGVLEEGVLVAGDRAPDAPGLVAANNSNTGTETRLFDVFSPTYHTVLVFAPDISSSTDIIETLKKYPKYVLRPVVVLPQASDSPTHVDAVIDRDGHAYQAYLAKGEKKVVVVRPDGVVGAIVHGAEERDLWPADDMYALLRVAGHSERVNTQYVTAVGMDARKAEKFFQK